ncbi:MAG: hypothetical protein CM15mP62_12200 [Rhodospirillaceae bacterium]|nr:MAG: hypothetical protein CM15mP62_12200 [Rhodospirillaceae bacterium]
MPKTEFREIECLVIMERPPEKAPQTSYPLMSVFVQKLTPQLVN